MKPLKLSLSFRIGCWLLIVFGIVQLFVNPIALITNFATISRIRDELPDAKARWLSNRITDYEIDVEGFVPLLCVYDARLTVQDDKITAVAVREHILDKTSPMILLEPAKWDTSTGCSHSKLAITSMFDQVEQNLDISVWDASLEVKFDEQYGFVSDYEVRYGYRTGGVSECCVRFKFRNFQPISE